MEKKRIGLSWRNRKVNLDVRVVPKWFEGIGLMFSRRSRARALLFSFDKLTRIAIHSFFVFYDFYAVWLDGKGKIIEIRRVKPFRCNILPSRKFVKLIEVPINDFYDEVLQILDGKETFK